MKRFLAAFLLVASTFTTASAGEDLSYKIYFDLPHGEMLRVHDQQTCDDPQVLSSAPEQIIPFLAYATLVDRQHNILRRACVVIDPEDKTYTFIFLDNYSTLTEPLSAAKGNPNPRDPSEPDNAIPYRPDYNGPFYHSV